jgi:hypothetical protein
MLRFSLMALFALTAIMSALPAYAQTGDGRYNIMAPETSDPWLPPTYKSPRGLPQHVVIPQPAPTRQPRTAAPALFYVPRTGQLVPNLPIISGSGPRGAETSQDRAVRCAHQAGTSGPAGGDRNAYVGGCINQ